MLIDPLHANAYNSLGSIYRDLGEFDKAIRCLNKTLELNQNFPQSHMVLSIIYWLQRKWELCRFHIKAIASYTKGNNTNLNQFIIPYRQFLSTLLKLQSEHPRLYDSEITEKILYAIGDSHCLSYSHTCVVLNSDKHFIKSKIIIGCKAWHLAMERGNKYKLQLEQIVKKLPNKSKVMMMFGEIDCRPDQGILAYHKKSQTPLDIIIKNLVDKYIDYVCNLLGKREVSPIFYGVPAPVLKDKNLNKNDREKMRRIVKKINHYLLDNLNYRNYLFLDPYSLTCNSDRESNEQILLDGIHLKPSALQMIIDNTSF